VAKTILYERVYRPLMRQLAPNDRHLVFAIKAHGGQEVTMQAL
jgi:hypothetical protein